jgi:hypothetical protein
MTIADTFHPGIRAVEVPPHEGSGPLSPQHMQELAEAKVRAKKIRRAAGVAALSGWTMALFAGITLLGGLFGDWVAVALGAGLSVVAFNELRGAEMIKRFDPAGARRLGFNQIALGLLLVVYAAWSLWSALRTPILASAGSTGDPDMDATIGRISNLVAYGLYGGLAVAGVVAPGLTALYYFTRGRLIRAMVEQTPAWVIQTMRAAG